MGKKHASQYANFGWLHYVRKDDDDFKPHQAEVMVKTFVPKKYIVNLDKF